MRIVVTGAASPLGRAVVEQLVRQGHSVVGVVRRLSGVKQMERAGAEPFIGDVRRPEQVVRALAKADGVFHLAGFFDFWEPVDGTYESVNVGGTRNVLAGALVAGVKRVVVSSSAITVGEEPGEMGHEFTRHRGHTRTALEASKLEAERLALRTRKRGLEVVIVNPGLVVAPRDPGWMGRLIGRTVSGRRPLASQAPLSWVWVDDAARGVIRASDVGADGARYILSGDVMSSQRFLGLMASSVGAPPPRAVPERLALAEAMFSTAVARPLRRRPALPVDEARFLTTGCKVDGSYAAQELGIAYTPAARYLPGLARDYAETARRFGKA